MTCRTLSLKVLVAAAACFLGSQKSEAGVIPWIYDAIFGYHGPAFGGGGCLGGGCLGRGCLGMGGVGYPMGGYGMPMGGYGYPAGGYGGYPMGGYMPTYTGYAPSYMAPAMGPCSTGCGPVSVNYGPSCGDCCGVSTFSSGCSSCSGTVDSQYSPPANSGNSDVAPTPATPPANKPLPTDGFGPVRPMDNDPIVPSGGEAPGWSQPIQPRNPTGDSVIPSDPATDPLNQPANPNFRFESFPGTEFEVRPIEVEPKVASSIEPVRRRTSFSAPQKLPTVARVAVSPSSQTATPASLASK